MVIELTRKFNQRVNNFKDEAHRILSKHETAKSRVVSLDETRRLLKVLSLKQDELFQEALGCIEKGIYRAAHVMAWAGFMDFLQEKISSDGLVKLMSLRPGWSKHKTIEDIRDNIPEFQLIEAARDMKLLSKSESKTLLGLLSKRNECAHPSGYKPNMNESLGYVSELLNRIDKLHTKQI
jgi:hypothetical protein